MSPEPRVISCKVMSKLIRKEKVAMLVQVHPMHSHTAKIKHNEKLQQLLHQYTDLFETPTQLPPSREQDHMIELLPNTAPLSVRPYQYPHFQKEEIEKIV